jgi:hypothetical protein
MRLNYFASFHEIEIAIFHEIEFFITRLNG